MAEAEADTAPLPREYETIYVLRPNVSPDGAKKVNGRVEEATAKTGGKLTLVETWGRRPLAYPVKKHRRGVYVYLRYIGGGEVVNELERNFRMLDEVLKYQTVKVRDDVDPSALAVDPSTVQFEEIQPPGEDEEDESLERQLGLEPPESRARPAEPSGGDESSGDGDSEQQKPEQQKADQPKPDQEKPAQEKPDQPKPAKAESEAKSDGEAEEED